MYNIVVCGGTFDRLHVGHMFFLDTAFKEGKHVAIGLTSDAYIKKYKSNQLILPYETRLIDLKQFLLDRGYMKRAEIFPIDDVYGKALDPSCNFDAILVTDSTRKGAEIINKKRKSQGLPVLSLVSASLEKITDKQIISSTLIRSGIIGRMGEFFPNPQWTEKNVRLPQDLRHIFHKPLGELLRNEIPDEYIKHPEKIISIGDATTQRLHGMGVKPKICVIDFLVERKKKYSSLDELGFGKRTTIFSVVNPAGSLTKEVWEQMMKIHQSLDTRKEIVLRVDGEEDLLVLPFALLMPLGWTIFYGQPHEGLVRLSITEKLKMDMFSFLQKFSQS